MALIAILLEDGDERPMLQTLTLFNENCRKC